MAGRGADLTFTAWWVGPSASMGAVPSVDRGTAALVFRRRVLQSLHVEGLLLERESPQQPGLRGGGPQRDDQKTRCCLAMPSRLYPEKHHFVISS